MNGSKTIMTKILDPIMKNIMQTVVVVIELPQRELIKIKANLINYIFTPMK